MPSGARHQAGFAHLARGQHVTEVSGHRAVEQFLIGPAFDVTRSVGSQCAARYIKVVLSWFGHCQYLSTAEDAAGTPKGSDYQFFPPRSSASSAVDTLMLFEISGVKLASDLRRTPVLAANQTGGAQPLKAHLVFALIAEKYLAQGVLQPFIFLKRPGVTAQVIAERAGFVRRYVLQFRQSQPGIEQNIQRLPHEIRLSAEQICQFPNLRRCLQRAIMSVIKLGNLSFVKIIEPDGKTDVERRLIDVLNPEMRFGRMRDDQIQPRPSLVYSPFVVPRANEGEKLIAVWIAEYLVRFVEEEQNGRFGVGQNGVFDEVGQIVFGAQCFIPHLGGLGRGFEVTRQSLRQVTKQTVKRIELIGAQPLEIVVKGFAPALLRRRNGGREQRAFAHLPHAFDDDRLAVAFDFFRLLGVGVAVNIKRRAQRNRAGGKPSPL